MAGGLEDAVNAMLFAAKNRDKVAFALPENRFLKHKRKRDERSSRRGLKRMVRPENAAGFVAMMPAPDEILHAVLRGDFVLGDALPLILKNCGPCGHLRVCTLGLSVKNAEMLRDLVQSGAVSGLTLVVSHYFQAVDKTSTFLAVSQILRDVGGLKVSRCHAKIILIPSHRGDFYVVEGSANLRSSDTIEQVSVFNDSDLHAFHAAWIDELPVGIAA